MKHPKITARVITKEEAERLGYECGMYGADTKNCHFSIFRTVELMKAWTKGRDKAIAEKKSKSQA